MSLHLAANIVDFGSGVHLLRQLVAALDSLGPLPSGQTQG
tara:strand:+ start:699 stop:818 length:120 start_codon:yes stop_codon:yes gene_type:complete